MKYCYNCNRVTTGENIQFCNFCGRTYDVKLCPRLHVNPRNAQVCSQCGSRDFSTPQPKVSLGARILVVAVTIVLGSALFFFSILFIVVALTRIFSDPDVQSGLACLAILIAL